MKSVASIKNSWAGSRVKQFFSNRLAKRDATGRNRRKYFRFDCEVPVELHLDSPGQLSIINAVARNISAGGMLIKCPMVPASLTPCHVSFHVPDWFPGAHQNREVMAYAHVLHADSARRLFGVAFSNPL